MGFLWCCPHCNRDTTITSERKSYDTHRLGINTDQTLDDKRDVGITTKFIVCPSEKCQKYTLVAELVTLISTPYGWVKEKQIKHLSIVPQSSAKSFPPFIPQAIIEDYEEACLILDLSPKASSTLSRRCLQGMIRDYWGVNVKSGKLYDEIDAIKDEVEVEIWKAMEAVRKVGNVGAHMQQEVDLIIDVEPQEAKLLIGLIERLLKEWYVHREERSKMLAEIVDLADDKVEAKKQGSEEDTTETSE